MKDLVPKGTGNSRLLRSSIPADITFAEMVTMLRNGTFPVDFAGLNSAGVAVVGSAYNKANVLPDDICSGLGIPTTSEPKDAFIAAHKKSWRELTRITTSQKWTVPDGVYQIGVFIMSGGQGGKADRSSDYYDTDVLGGNAGGIRCVIIDVTPGQQFSVVIGAGGIGQISARYSSNERSATPGGNTSFGDYVADGTNYYTYAENIDVSVNSPVGLYQPLAGKNKIALDLSQLGNIFDEKMVVGSAGGSVSLYEKSSSFTLGKPTECSLGKGGAPNLLVEVDTIGEDATGYGNGGGAALCIFDYAETATGGNGSPGIVIIYV